VLFVGFLLVASVCFLGADASVHGPYSTPEEAELHKVGRTVQFGPDNVTQHIGYINVNGTFSNGAHLFYWMFESRVNPTTAPLVLWLTGGPGCSSELALFSENGPYKISNNLNMTLNPYSWNSFANLLYVDQPVGTGFSYTEDQDDYVTSEDQVSNDMYTFLQKWFDRYPQYAKLPFFIMGESYAGHYVPAISARIIRGNQNGRFGKFINLKGSAIGNGWVDPKVQYGAYADFAYANNLINYATYVALFPVYEACSFLIELGLYTQAYSECGAILTTILFEAGNINVYDIRKQCNYAPLCYDFNNIATFMNLPSTKKALGVTRDWQFCDGEVYSKLTPDDWIHNLARDVPLLLAQPNYRVLAYYGKEDFICNWMGGQSWVTQLKWPGHDGFVQAPTNDWKVAGQVAGQVKTYKGLTFLGIEKAGHLVPMDQPANSLAMLKSFLNGTPY